MPSGDLCYKPKGDVGRPFGGKREGVSGSRSSPFEGAESTPNNHNWVKTLITGGSISLGCFGSLLDPLQHIQNKLRAKIRGSQILQLNADKQERRIWDSGVCNAWKKDYFFFKAKLIPMRCTGEFTWTMWMLFQVSSCSYSCIQPTPAV